MVFPVTLAMAACAPVSAQAPGSAAAPACGFDCTLERHIRAIQTHDYAEFEATVTRRPEIELIYPGGQRVSGRDAFLADQREFLASEYSFEYELVRRHVGSDMGVALLDVTFNAPGRPAPSRFYLLLGFALEDGEWRLVHDQNTRQPAPEAPAQ